MPSPEGPSQLVGIDFCGTFKRTRRKSQYVFVLQIILRDVSGVALLDCTPPITMKSILEDYTCKYGVSKTIISVQGTHLDPLWMMVQGL